jgi:hypothetical protein
LPNFWETLSLVTVAFLVCKAMEDPRQFVRRMAYFLEILCVIVHAPLDIIQEYINDTVRYKENLRKYKLEKKKHLYWDQVPSETKLTWDEQKALKTSRALLAQPRNPSQTQKPVAAAAAKKPIDSGRSHRRMNR